MPSRVVRGEINSSESLAAVSPEAELTFRALLMAVDDYGRADARPAMLKAALFPMRDAFTGERIVALMHELASIPDPPIVLYAVDGRPYVQLTGWEKHRGKQGRAKESRFPAPPEIRGDPGDSRRSERLTSDVWRVTSDEKREEPEAPASPDATPPDGSSSPDPPWGNLERLLKDCGARPPPEPDERMAWLYAVWPEIAAAAQAESPDGASRRQVSAREVRIAHARWRVYLRGPREHRGAAERARLNAAADAWDARYGAQAEAEEAAFEHEREARRQ